MSVKRTKDPAGLLGDHVRIDFTDPHPGDAKALLSSFEYASPQKRIARLRRHVQLGPRADAIAERLAVLGGSADHALHAEIASAEVIAIYLDAAPAVIEKRRRQAAASALSDQDVLDARARCKTRKEAADQLGIDPRHLRRRLASINKKRTR